MIFTNNNSSQPPVFRKSTAGWHLWWIISLELSCDEVVMELHVCTPLTWLQPWLQDLLWTHSRDLFGAENSRDLHFKQTIKRSQLEEAGNCLFKSFGLKQIGLTVKWIVWIQRVGSSQNCKSTKSRGAILKWSWSEKRRTRGSWFCLCRFWKERIHGMKGRLQNYVILEVAIK